MRSLAAQISALFTLLAFLVTTSGWVMHRHYCPESEQQVISLFHAAACSEPMTSTPEIPASCCEKPAILPLPTCATDDGCCKDEVILLELSSPFTLSVYQNEVSALEVVQAAPLRLEIALWQVVPAAEMPTHPLPPPPLRCLDRLNELQVYRT